MRVAVIGAGYAGLVTGVVSANRENDVCLVVIDPQKAALKNQSKAPLHEEGLEPLLQNSVWKNLKATVDINEAVTNAEEAVSGAEFGFHGQRMERVQQPRSLPGKESL